MLKKVLSLIIVFVLVAFPTSAAFAEKPTDVDHKGKPAEPSHKNTPSISSQNNNMTVSGKKDVTTNNANQNGFDVSGYNRTVRIFNGTGMSWCMEKVGDETWCLDYLGESANDKLVMKWNAEWERGNAEGWSKPPYDAWENNEWNGMVPGGSGSVWHYKIVWVGDCGVDYTPLDNGGYCIWGQFATIMDQGTDSDGHYWFAHGFPTGYGSYP